MAKMVVSINPALSVEFIANQTIHLLQSIE
jgi:hypothetical protein